MFASALAVLAVAGFSGLASAQASNSSSSPQSTYPYLINPNDPSITQTNRTTWCNAQRNSCPLLCAASGAIQNNCDTTTLTYTCMCGDMTTPNVTAYTQTLPFFECLQYIQECVANTPETDATGRTACQNTPCGPKGDPATFAAQVSSSIMAGASSTSAPTMMSSASAASATTAASAQATHTGAAAYNYGPGVAVLGGLGLLGLAL